MPVQSHCSATRARQPDDKMLGITPWQWETSVTKIAPEKYTSTQRNYTKLFVAVPSSKRELQARVLRQFVHQLQSRGSSICKSANVSWFDCLILRCRRKISKKVIHPTKQFLWFLDASSMDSISAGCLPGNTEFRTPQVLFCITVNVRAAGPCRLGKSELYNVRTHLVLLSHPPPTIVSEAVVQRSRRSGPFCSLFKHEIFATRISGKKYRKCVG